MEPNQIHCVATRNAVLRAVYERGWVAHGAQMRAWESKDFHIRKLTEWNPRAARFFPKSLLLSLAPRDLGELKVWLAREFPTGFLVKPDRAHSSEGENFLREVDALAPHMPEADQWLVQAQIADRAFVRENELRVHTFWHRVVRGATYSRWDLFWDETLFAEVEDAVQSALDLFPPSHLQGHAWGLDVIRTAPGRVVIADLNTNRGERRQWSGDLSIPDALGAYVRHWEEHFRVQFAGEEGEKLRQGLGNREKWFGKAGTEAVLRHEGLKSGRP